MPSVASSPRCPLWCARHATPDHTLDACRPDGRVVRLHYGQRVGGARLEQLEVIDRRGYASRSEVRVDGGDELPALDDVRALLASVSDLSLAGAA